MKKQVLRMFGLLPAILLAVGFAQAQDSELAGANWIDLVKGGKSEATGAEVREVKTEEVGS